MHILKYLHNAVLMFCSHSSVLFKLRLINVLTTLWSSRLFRGGRAAPAPAAVHGRAGALQWAQAWGERGEPAVWDCEATLWAGGLLRVTLTLLLSWYLL